MASINRRQFIGYGTSLAAGGAILSGVHSFSNGAFGKEPLPEKTGKVKFSVFADIHHYPGVFMSQTPDHLVQIQNRAVKENCDFIIHCGDFTHNPPKFMDFINLYNNFKIPSYHVLGNHDQDGCDWEESVKCYKMPAGHYFFDRGGFRFVILDANYINKDGVFTHYSKGNYYKAKGNEIPWIPPEQIAWLKKTLTETTNPCVLFSHQSYEREVGGIQNWSEIRSLIDAVNKQYPGRVRLCINGHHHRDFLRILNDVVYFDLNSASYDWVEKRHDLYPKELCDKYSLVNHTVVYNDPIHAVITLEADGLMKIEGMESSMLLGVTREKAKLPFGDGSGRPVFPRVQSATLKFCYE